MDQLFHFTQARRNDLAVAEWVAEHTHTTGKLAARWFHYIHDCGEDVNELVHDGHPTACVTDAAFAYVGAFKAHVNVGFFRGVDLPDPQGILQGSGRAMRHVKLKPGDEAQTAALQALIQAAYQDMRLRLAPDE